jgi:ATP-binding protein involved in chromosome partitioning
LWHCRSGNSATWGGGRARRLRLSAAPIDLPLREGAHADKPLVVSDPDAPASQALLEIAAALPPRRSLAGRRLTLLT